MVMLQPSDTTCHIYVALQHKLVDLCLNTWMPTAPTLAPAHGRFYTYVLNNTNVLITITYSQKYVLFEIMYT